MQLKAWYQAETNAAANSGLSKLVGNKKDVANKYSKLDLETVQTLDFPCPCKAPKAKYVVTRTSSGQGASIPSNDRCVASSDLILFCRGYAFYTRVSRCIRTVKELCHSF
jgi:hypothetical protein